MNYLIPALFAFVSIEEACGFRLRQGNHSHVQPRDRDTHLEKENDSHIEPRLTVLSTCSCGVKTLNKIIGGQEATKNEYPWMVAICYGTPCNFDRQFCGGSLINSLYVLTAAHCVKGQTASNIYVSIGDHNLETTNETYSVERSAEAIIIHTDYSSTTQKNDIALIKLNQEVMFSSTILPICLPSPAQSYAGNNATVTGWGDIDPSSAVLKPTNLYEVDVQVISNTQCTTTGTYTTSEIFSSMLCAAAVGKDSCQGDSGGPLIYNDRGYWEQVGIVSWGYGCAEPGFPGVYTRVTSFNTWILDNIGTAGVWCIDVAQ